MAALGFFLPAKMDHDAVNFVGSGSCNQPYTMLSLRLGPNGPTVRESVSYPLDQAVAKVLKPHHLTWARQSGLLVSIAEEPQRLRAEAAYVGRHSEMVHHGR